MAGDVEGTEPAVAVHTEMPAGPPLEKKRRAWFGSDLPPYVKAGRAIRMLAVVALILGLPFPIVWFVSHGFDRVLAGAALLCTALMVASGIYLTADAIFKHRPVGRYVGIAIGMVLLAGFPLGTLIGIYLIWILALSWNKRWVEPVVGAASSGPDANLP